MQTLLCWAVIVAAVTGASWWLVPQAPDPDLSPFGDLGRVVAGEAPLWRDVPRAVGVRYAVAVRMLPALAGLLLVGVAAGLFFRERASYASPTLAWFAKRTILGALALLILFVLTPFAWPMWVPYAAGAAAAGGASTYVANLPARL